MSEFEIVKARKRDASAISNLLVQLGYETAPSKIETLLSKPSGGDPIYLGIVNGNIVAVMSLIFFDYFPSAEKLCRITSLVVDQGVRGTGIGSTLIDHAKSIALAENCTALELTTSFRRERTQAYYEKIGFQKTSYKYVLKLKGGV
ncbi:MAG: GNAT family N-acetyltransferase [Motiliproteus sp.]